MKYSLLTAIFAFAFGIASLNAQEAGESIDDYQLAFPIEFSGKAYLQDTISEVGNQNTYSTSNFTFSSDDVLSEFPSNSELYLVGDTFGTTAMAIVNSATGEITEIVGRSSLPRIELEDSSFIDYLALRGFSDYASGEEKIKATYSTPILISFGSNTVSILGNYKSKYRFSEITDESRQFRGTLKGRGNGYGALSGETLILIEKIKLKGSMRRDVHVHQND